MSRFTIEEAQQLLDKHEQIAEPVREYLNHVVEGTLVDYYAHRFDNLRSVFLKEKSNLGNLVYHASSDSFNQATDGESPNYLSILKYSIKLAMADGALDLETNGSSMLKSFLSYILNSNLTNRTLHNEDALYHIHMGFKFLNNYFKHKTNTEIESVQ